MPRHLRAHTQPRQEEASRRAPEENVLLGAFTAEAAYYHCTRSDQSDFVLLYLSPPFSDPGRTLTGRSCMVFGTMGEILKRIRPGEQEVRGLLRAKQEVHNPEPVSEPRSNALSWASERRFLSPPRHAGI